MFTWYFKPKDKHIMFYFLTWNDAGLEVQKRFTSVFRDLRLEFNITLLSKIVIR